MKIKKFDYSVEFMHSLFGTIGLKLSKSLTGMLAVLVVCLLGGAEENLVSLAEALPYDGTTLLVRMQRIRRFLSNSGISPSKTLIPLIRLLRPKLEELDEIVLTMDRTEWKKRGNVVNILTVALSYKGSAIPLFWLVLDRKGNASLEHWKHVLAPVIETLQQMEWISARIHVVADCEFASPKLSEWLKVMTTLDGTEVTKADTVYGLRFGIEAMHKDWRSTELEKSRITDPKRIETMLILTSFAYVLCVFKGERREEAEEV